ncbi:MAG: hypothetical protein WC369_05135 [Dehalococcoidales bacterium]
MEIDDERIKRAVRHTEIIRLPTQSLATFGTTNLAYFLLTEPAYQEAAGEAAETVVREGRVIAEKPRIVTPYYLSRLEGFSGNARRYLGMLLETQGAHTPGLFYTYKNELRQTNIVTENMRAVVRKINEEIDRKADPLTSIIKGEDELWDVSLLKFIYEMTKSSLGHNMRQLQSRGMLDIDSGGIPQDARLRIEELFREVTRGEREPKELKEELDRWDIFEEYQDRFFATFKRRS